MGNEECDDGLPDGEFSWPFQVKATVKDFKEAFHALPRVVQ
jgi:hypothetical protein